VAVAVFCWSASAILASAWAVVTVETSAMGPLMLLVIALICIYKAVQSL
jgi:hypothetical protein